MKKRTWGLLAAIAIGALGVGGIAYAMKRTSYGSPRIALGSSNVLVGNLLSVNGSGFTPNGEVCQKILKPPF